MVQTRRQRPSRDRAADRQGDWHRLLGAEFIAITAGDLTAFGSAARLAIYAGLAPVPDDSGKRKGVLHRPRRYHRQLRHIFYMAAFSSLKADGPSRQSYARKRSE